MAEGMQTATQIVGLLTPPERRTVEFKVIFTQKDYMLARELCRKYGDRIGEPLSEDTPLADRLQDMQMLMFRLEQHKASQS